MYNVLLDISVRATEVLLYLMYNVFEISRVVGRCIEAAIYSRTSLARTLMVRLPRLFRTHS